MASSRFKRSVGRTNCNDLRPITESVGDPIVRIATESRQAFPVTTPPTAATAAIGAGHDVGTHYVGAVARNAGRRPRWGRWGVGKALGDSGRRSLWVRRRHGYGLSLRGVLTPASGDRCRHQQCGYSENTSAHARNANSGMNCQYGNCLAWRAAPSPSSRRGHSIHLNLEGFLQTLEGSTLQTRAVGQRRHVRVSVGIAGVRVNAVWPCSI